MCPNCRAFITTDDKVCPYCGFRPGRTVRQLAGTDSPLSRLIPHAQYATFILLLANVAVFIAAAITSLKAGELGSLMTLDRVTAARFGAKVPALMLGDGQWWRLVTAGFLHWNLFHILMNMWVLFDLSALVEQLFGLRRMVVIYFLTTVVGFFASTILSPYSLSAGASAGLFGFIGALIGFGIRERNAQLRGFFVRWLIYGVLLSFLFNADQAAHFGGAISGFIVAFLAGSPRLVENFREKMWGVAMWACIIITAVSFAKMFLFFLATAN
jgi:membrane associated rhomboid family serine protease